MRRKSPVRLLTVAVVLGAVPAFAGEPDPAAKAFADGKALLAKSDFAGALDAFKRAARDNPGKVEYRQQCAILRQVITMREQIKEEENHDRWVRLAAALRKFYYDNAVFAEALLLDRENHKRHPGTETAAMLAETQLALGKNIEAEKTLASLPPKKTTTRTNVLLGIALARQEKIDDARTLAGTAKVRDSLGSHGLYELARLRALVGAHEGSLEALARSFELTPPSQLDAAKADAKNCKDFGKLASTPEFGKVLLTASKIKESGCSSGTACGKCPYRSGTSAQCPKSAANARQPCGMNQSKP
jgi:tetratricopeptide (TPR) repeat protein